MQRIAGYLQEDQRLIDGGTPDHRSLQESHIPWTLTDPSRVTLLADVISESAYARRFMR